MTKCAASRQRDKDMFSSILKQLSLSILSKNAFLSAVDLFLKNIYLKKKSFRMLNSLDPDHCV